MVTASTGRWCPLAKKYVEAPPRKSLNIRLLCLKAVTKRSDVKTIQRWFCSDKSRSRCRKISNRRLTEVSVTNDVTPLWWMWETKKWRNQPYPHHPVTPAPNIQKTVHLYWQKLAFLERDIGKCWRYDNRKWANRWGQRKGRSRHKVEKCRLWHSRNERLNKGCNGVSCTDTKVKKWEWQQ